MAQTIVTCPTCGKRNRISPRSEGVPRCAQCHSLLPWMVDAGSSDLDAELRASVPVLIDFWAPWCGPCKWISPIVEALARDRAGSLKVVRVNTDEAPDLAERYEIRGIPTLVVVRDGAEVDRLAGAAPRPQLEAWLEKHLERAAHAS
jgi:thioredoxin 2